MLQDEDYKIRNTIDKLSKSSPSVGSKLTSWWQGFSTAFTTSASRAALQINTVIDRAFTPEPDSASPGSASPELVAPVQLKMDDKRLVSTSPYGTSPLARQESFIEPFTSTPTCDCHCSVPECTTVAPEPESAPVEVVSTANALDTDSDSTFAFTKTNEGGSEPALGPEPALVASEAEKKEV